MDSEYKQCHVLPSETKADMLQDDFNPLSFVFSSECKFQILESTDFKYINEVGTSSVNPNNCHIKDYEHNAKIII